MSQPTPHPEPSRIPARIAAVLGVLGLVAVLPFYLASGLVAPVWAIGLLWAVWLALAVMAVRWFTRRPWVVLVLPLLAVAIWWTAITLGEQALGWQA